MDDRSVMNLKSSDSLKQEVDKKIMFNIVQVSIDCLVRYCTITGRTEYKIHWSDELRGHLLTISRFSIKGNDSIESRRKVLQEIWSENDYNQTQFLNMTVVNKFLKEGIDTSVAEYGQVLKDCIDAEQDLFDVILSRNVELITNYSRNI